MSTTPVPPPKVQHARVNGVDLAYVEQGHGVPVVLVHGGAGDHRHWEGQREAVAERYRFIAPTQRYFGTDPWPDDGSAFSMATHADDLAAFIRHLNGGPAHVVGWSYGGAIAIVLAVHHPEWVKSLFVFEPGLATFVTDPADVQVSGEDRKDMRAPAATATEAGDTGAAVRLLIDGVTGQPGAFHRLTPAFRSALLDNARTLPPFFGAPPPPPITCAQLGRSRCQWPSREENWRGPSTGLRRTRPTAAFSGRDSSSFPEEGTSRRPNMPRHSTKCAWAS